jgi:uridylate kinase
MEEKIIISLGGSLIIPEEVDTDFLKEFRDLIISEIEKGKKFVIITGGGKICRKYDSAASKVRAMQNDELDWLGIFSTRFNAQFVRLLFGEHAEGGIIEDPTLPINFSKSVVLGGGWKPGNSTDHVAVLIAKNIGAKKIINLSNTDYVYDSDPRTNPEARKIERISWAEYRAIIPKEWNPGLNTPFDPIASELAEKNGITVMTMNGKPIDNLRKCLKGDNFLGTTIS